MRLCLATIFEWSVVMVEDSFTPGEADDVLVEVWHSTFEFDTVKDPCHHKCSNLAMMLVLIESLMYFI